MISSLVGPATPEDAASAADQFPDLLPDRWRGGNNRRSFAANSLDGTVVGHCRGIDNDYHPATRVLVHEMDPAYQGTQLEDALLAAQLEVSTLPLTIKATARDLAMVDLAARHGGYIYQLCPPWRRVVRPELRAWAAEHASGAHGEKPEPASTAAAADHGGAAPAASDRAEIARLEAEHYVAQHAGWDPSADADTLTTLFADDHDPASGSSWDAERSRIIRREGRVVAAALLWPAEESDSDSLALAGQTERAGDAAAETEQAATESAGAEQPGREISLISDRYGTPESWADKLACLAAIIDTADDGDVLLVDSHLTEQMEREQIAAIPGLDPAYDWEWTALIAIPLPGAATGAGPDSGSEQNDVANIRLPGALRADKRNLVDGPVPMPRVLAPANLKSVGLAWAEPLLR